MPEPIKAIVIDPQAKTIREMAIPTKEPEPNVGCGLQLEFDCVKEIICCRLLEFVFLPSGKDLLMLDEEGLLDGDPNKDFFQLEEKWPPMAGTAVIVGHDLKMDAYRDPIITVADIAGTLRWSRRYVRGVNGSEPREGVIKAELDSLEIHEPGNA
jgi:hypothetical protein